MTPNALMNWTKVEIKQRISGYDTWNKITCEASATDLVNQKKKNRSPSVLSHSAYQQISTGKSRI